MTKEQNYVFNHRRTPSIGLVIPDITVMTKLSAYNFDAIHPHLNQGWALSENGNPADIRAWLDQQGEDPFNVYTIDGMAWNEGCMITLQRQGNSYVVIDVQIYSLPDEEVV